jgi:GDPmannose 4,6-dehydratase
MKTALITGIAGQDGPYLAELLLSKGYCVIGATRNPGQAKERLSAALQDGVELIRWDMRDQSGMTEIFRQYRPQEIYNFAAYSSGAGMFDDSIDVGDINGLAVTRMLESIRAVDVNIRFCQASSREIFGEASETPQTESTRLNPRSPYGAAKLYADSMIRIYRQHYKLFACSAILFNHESPRRGLEFVTRKITHQVARIKLGLESKLCLGNLNAERDWGFAGDYVEAMWLMLQQKFPDDYILATGETRTVREFCELAFRHLDLDYRDYVQEDLSVLRPAERVQLVGSAVKARENLDWIPKTSFSELVRMMVDEDLHSLSRQN